MRGRPKPFAAFVGGVNKRDAPGLVGDTEARDARNVQATVRGAVRKRDGSQSFAVPPVALTSLYPSQVPDFLIGAGSTSLYSISPAGVVASIASGLTDSALWEWIQAPANGGQGPLYGFGGGAARQWTGSGGTAAWTAASGTLPLGKYVIYNGLRVWVAGMAAYGSVPDPGSTLVFSDLGNPRAWPVENVVQFDPNDGEQITGIGSVGPYVLVFKPSKCWAVYDLDTGANRLLAENIGCVAHRSIVETQDGTYFLSRDQGVFRTNGSTVHRLNDKLQPVIDGLVQANRQLACAAFYRGHYYLSISDAGAANTILLDYDLQLDSWWLHTLPSAQLALWEPAGDLGLYSAAPALAKRVDKLFVSGRTQDASDAGDLLYPAYWRGPHHKLGARRTRVRALTFEGSGKIQVSVAKDAASYPTVVGDADFLSQNGAWEDSDGLWTSDVDGGQWAGVADVTEAELANLGVARTWSVQFGNEADDPFEVDSYTFWRSDRTD